MMDSSSSPPPVETSCSCCTTPPSAADVKQVLAEDLRKPVVDTPGATDKADSVCSEGCCSDDEEKNQKCVQKAVNDCKEGCCGAVEAEPTSQKPGEEASADCGCGGSKQDDCQSEGIQKVAQKPYEDACNCCASEEDCGDSVAGGSCKKGCCVSEVERIEAGESNDACDCCSSSDKGDCDSEKDEECQAGCCGRPADGEKTNAQEQVEDDCDCCASDDNSSAKSLKAKELGIDDDSACPCCIQVLISRPVLKERLERPSSVLNDVVETAKSRLENSTRILRACCKILEEYCVGHSCCYVSPTTQANVSSKPKTRTQSKTAITNGAVASKPASLNSAGPLHKLYLEIRGMDCPDCTPKVLKALSQLPSVRSSSVDYFSGIAELQHDPEIITPSAVASYVARATGFGVRSMADAHAKRDNTTMTLPLLFSRKLPMDAFASFDIVECLDPNAIEISFEIGPEKPHRPRDILERFRPYGVTLVATGAGAREDNATRDLVFTSLRTVASAVLSVPVLVLAWAPLPHRPVLYGGICVVLTTGIQLLGYGIVSSAVRTIFYLHQIDLSVLVAVSTLTAYFFSIFAYAFEVAGNPFSDPFFETTALLITLILLGRTISGATRRSTRSALIELERLQANDVLLVSNSNNKGESVESLDARLLFYGDTIRIPPDTRVPTDGIIVNGSSDVDESNLTGESVALPKEKGNRVIAGTLNLSGTLDVQITKLVHENSLSNIATLVKHAQLSHGSSPVQDLADRLASWILPVASFAAVTAFVVWILVGIYVKEMGTRGAAVAALTYLIAVFVVSCPCAIGLAVPMVVSRSIRIALKEGLLFRSAAALQKANEVDTVVFDKTGTLTEGSFSVERVEILVKGAEHLMMALVKDNKHPISQGVYRYLAAQSASATPSEEPPEKEVAEKMSSVCNITSLPGKGIKATVSSFPLLGGSSSFTGACDHPIDLDLRTSGLSIFSVTLAGRPLAFFGLADTPRASTKALVRALIEERGLRVVIMSGDTPSSVHRLAEDVGVRSENVHAGCTPEDKDGAIASMQARGRKVLFVGDGTNDAPALSRADVSLAVSHGAGGGNGGSSSAASATSEVAVGSASTVLLNPDLSLGVLTLLSIAHDAKTHSLLALGWCVVYNVFAILLAAGAFVKVRIEPRWAGIGEVVSVLPVVVVALWLDVRWRKGLPN